MAISRDEGPKAYSIAEARDHLARIVHDVEEGHPVALTRRGKPVAMLVSMEEYERNRQPTKSFWEAMMEWRARTNLDEIDVDEWLEGTRDESPGRDFSW